jgi:hypothetical protein
MTPWETVTEEVIRVACNQKTGLGWVDPTTLGGGGWGQVKYRCKVLQLCAGTILDI